MRIAQLIAGLFALVAGQPLQADVALEDGRGSYYSGAEWVLDAEGHIVASSAVLVERDLDVPHRALAQKVVRESPHAGVLPRDSATTVTLLGMSTSPFALEGVASRQGARVEVLEGVVRGVLVIRETVRAADGRAVATHVIDATQLPREEYESWMARLPAP